VSSQSAIARRAESLEAPCRAAFAVDLVAGLAKRRNPPDDP
jgi:hypothetical protein